MNTNETQKLQLPTMPLQNVESEEQKDGQTVEVKPLSQQMQDRL